MGKDTAKSSKALTSKKKTSPKAKVAAKQVEVKKVATPKKASPKKTSLEKAKGTVATTSKTVAPKLKKVVKQAVNSKTAEVVVDAKKIIKKNIATKKTTEKKSSASKVIAGKVIKSETAPKNPIILKDTPVAEPLKKESKKSLTIETKKAPSANKKKAVTKKKSAEKSTPNQEKADAKVMSVDESQTIVVESEQDDVAPVIIDAEESVTVKAVEVKKTNEVEKVEADPSTDAETQVKARSGLKVGVRRKGPVGAKSNELKKAAPSKSTAKLRMCVRCPKTFEPLEKGDVVCPDCKDHVANRFFILFGDEDPYSPQPTMRTNKIARVIIRKKEEEIKAPMMENVVDRYDDE